MKCFSAKITLFTVAALLPLLSACTVSKTYVKASSEPGTQILMTRKCADTHCYKGYCSYASLRKSISEDDGTFSILFDFIWDTVKAPFTITYDLCARDCETVASMVSKEEKTAVAKKPEPGSDKELFPAPLAAHKNPDAVAVIIGIKDYKDKDVPSVLFALSDAAAFRAYAENTLGIAPANIITADNASAGDLERIFGNEVNETGQLANYIKPGKSDVLVYYSGHGAPDFSGKTAYLVPSDGDPDYVKVNGYSLALLYKNLNLLSAKSVTVVLEACFSGYSGGGTLLGKASPLAIEPVNGASLGKVNLFSSSSGRQISSWYPEKVHGLFTYYLLKNLKENGGADIAFGDLLAKVREDVSATARRVYGRDQLPQFAGDATAKLPLR